MEATTEFKISSGATVTVTVKLILSENINLDGDNIEVDCCKMGLVRADIDGFDQQVGLHVLPKAVSHSSGAMIYASIGKLGLTAENLEKVNVAIAELKNHPAWIAKQEAIEKNRKDIEEMEAAQDEHPGYCRKCGTYCYGDCEAN